MSRTTYVFQCVWVIRTVSKRKQMMMMMCVCVCERVCVCVCVRVHINKCLSLKAYSEGILCPEYIYIYECIRIRVILYVYVRVYL